MLFRFEMGVSHDAPSLDIAYKLVEYAGRGRLKLSAGKRVLPGRKQVFRVELGDFSDHDVLGKSDERVPGRPLLRRVMAGGARLAEGQATLDQVRAHAKAELDRLPPRLHDLQAATPAYRVEISPALANERDALSHPHEH